MEPVPSTSEDRTGRYDSYVESWRRRFAEQRAAGEELRARALEAAQRAADLLAEHYGVTKVVLFGSLAWRRPGPDSDIDLAVEGLAPESFYRADAHLARAIPIPIDLKLLAECPPLLRRRIEEEGVVLHEG
jgi:predicted nucleotidyltransferase